MILKWLTICITGLTILLTAGSPSFSQDDQQIAEQVYEELEYIASLFNSEEEIDPQRIAALIEFVNTIPEDTSLTLKKRNNMNGAFHAFQVDSSLKDLLDYAYNPEVPLYITMPSSVQSQQWTTPEIENELHRLINAAEAAGDTIFLRGQESETITPDTNTGGYYSYNQNRMVALLPGSSGPILLSATLQDQASEVGRKGCIIGDDGNWDYLFSDKAGLNKTGLGWVDSYMYEAYSVAVYIPDPAADTLKTGTFKWLNAGWKKINMVKAHHILGGIKRFAADLKGVLESPDLPEVEEIINKYLELLEKDEEELRRLVSPHLELISTTDNNGSCPESFISSVASGEYLEQMSSEEIIRILLLNYLKTHIGDNSSKTAKAGSTAGEGNWQKS